MSESKFFLNQTNQSLHEGTTLADMSLFSHSKPIEGTPPGCLGLSMVSGYQMGRDTQCEATLRVE